MAKALGAFLRIMLAVSRGHDPRYPFAVARRNDDTAGDPKVACEKRTYSALDWLEIANIATSSVDNDLEIESDTSTSTSTSRSERTLALDIPSSAVNVSGTGHNC